MIGQTISHYKILEKLGEGGMGVVYKAEDTRLHRPVALKFLPPELTRDPEAKERFTQEAQAASALDHPSIAVIHEIDQTQDGSSFICMAYYDGQTLKKRIEAGPLKIEETIDIAHQLAEGLQRAHEGGIVHRDLKPANVIITNRGEVKIVDFGLAKLMSGKRITKSGRTVGTAAYMSPEQARGEPVDHRSDIWSFGVLLYEMLSGQLPFKSDYEQALVYSILNENPQPVASLRSGVPSELEAIVNRCLEKDPPKRYESAVDLLGNLNRVKREKSSRTLVVARPKFATSLRSWRFVNKFVGLIAAVVLALLLLLLLPSGRTTVENWLGISAIPEQKHLAVLPFTNIGGESTNQAFCDGLVETLTSKLTQLEQFHGSLFVVPASEVRTRGTTSPSQARRAFGVTMAVTGSMQRVDDRVRVTINLNDAMSLRQLRSSVIDNQTENLSVLQDGLVRTLAEMLEIELLPESVPVLAAGGTNVPGAYDFYLQARGYLQRYEKMENIETAISLFGRALKEDSSYSLAYAGLGEAYWRKYEDSKDVQWVDHATKYCVRAVELNDELSPVHVTLGLIYRGTGRYEEAVHEFLRALELDPVSAHAYGELAMAYNALGNLEKAEATYKKAIELRPGYWAGYNKLGVFYYHQGRYDEAITQFEQVVELTPDNVRGYTNLGALYFVQESWEDAREMFERSLNIEPNYRAYSNLGTLYFFEGRYADASRMLEKAIQLQDNDYRLRGYLAAVYHWTPGKFEKAQDMFRHAAQMAEEQRKVNPRDPTLLSDLAGYHGMLGKSSEARRLLEEALALAPDDVEIIGGAGKIYEQLGDREQALQWIEKALNLGYSPTELEHSPGMRELRADARFQEILKAKAARP